MFSRESRRAAILDRVARDGEATVDALAAAFGVNAMTIRRDLDALARDGRLSRVHGGAVASRAGVVAFSFQRKSLLHAERKRAIAARAAALAESGMAVSLDTGTTTLEVARCLADARDLTVLTTSLAIASALHSNRNLEIVLLGGTVSRAKPDLTGPLTEENLRKFRVHIAFLGADAVTPDGMFTTDVQTAGICQAMIRHAHKAALVVDSSKFQQTAFVRYGTLKDLDVVVTDRSCPRRDRAWLKKRAREVVYA